MTTPNPISVTGSQPAIARPRFPWLIACVGLLLVTGVLGGSLYAALTAEHRKELAEIKKELGKVQGLITKKDVDGASKILDDAEAGLKKVASDAQIMDTDKAIAPLLKQIEGRRTTLAKKTGDTSKAGGISFVKEIAPILTARCTSCHGGGNPRSGLNMETFAGMKTGGSKGQLLIPGSPDQSAIVGRVKATGQGKMPPNGQPLAADQIQKLSQWIAQGAKFDGTDENQTLASAAAPNANKPVEIAKATGKEKSFYVKDIAPSMPNLCDNCHSGATPRDGFALDTFEKLMRGGKNGRVIIPGNPKDSRLWHLVGEQDPIKMPAGQALITEKNHSDLRVWIEEGAKFDGNDPKAALRSLVPTEAQKRAQEFAALTPEELLKRRKERTEGLWKAGLPNETLAQAETPDLLVMGNVSEARLQQITSWATEDLTMLKKIFQVKETPMWKGKLGLFIFKDHFSYGEFTQSNQNAMIPDDSTGHARVTAAGDEAYVCVQDVGDEVSSQSGGVRVVLMEQLTGALLSRAAKPVPQWLSRGTGLALASRRDYKATEPYFTSLNAEALGLIKTVEPASLFEDGTFSPSSVTPVGYTLVNHMLSAGEPQFVRFLSQVQEGSTVPAALKAVYSADAAQLALSYVQKLSTAKGAKKKIK